ncbi:phage tail tape measure protein [Burkholderia thailandensis]|uniref:Gp18 n=1 Tax=Burkholderia phage phiE255 TaxID=2883942 RepID=A4JWL0_9CAUD|nr:phage tail tape measure protein [Burkholderia thailandensis]YP_001111218.1 tail tape measure protein [Burkholderia phage phiE255]ABO60657.1 gp18 [Burkholderia phage phiE255]MCS6426421.1 phage tail tape measure protein [Burkholderia thailandensis]MCS6455056.1 phage tail tape measure protein [Burkholderia thailandensis]MCS6465637.1 phage tail tape measure protein [Burkholderia thailandensis]MCS6484450.1 phage tail tape measure protein [Burkholderia thailandensis]
MASEFYIGVKIGATLLGSFGTALSGTRTTLNGLGRVADELRAKHTRLGDAMARAVAHPMRNIAELRGQYDRLGRTIDQVQAKQATLATRLARGAALREQRQGLGADMLGTYATAVATAAPVVGAVKQAANFEAGLRDIAITGNLTRDEEFRIGETMRRAALATSQGHNSILEGVGTLVAAGMDAKEAGQKSNLLGRVATATNADMKDLAGMVYSFSETLGIKGDAALKEAFNRAAYGGKLGRFELKDMAKALPEMTAAFAAKGIKGQDALTQIIASLEVGREGAGSGDEAVTNLRNWLSHMNAKATIDAYKKAGVDYQKSMSNLVAGGYSSYEGSLQIAQKFIASRGDAFMKQWKAAGAKGDEEAQRKLMESFGLNEVFQDIQTINHLLAMRQGWDKYQQNKKDMGSAQALNTIDQDYARRAELATVAWGRLQTQIADLGITVGRALLPSLTDLMNTVTPLIQRTAQFAAAHPGLIRGLVGFATAVIGMKVATLAAGWGLNFFVKSPLNMVSTALTTVGAKWTLFRALWAGGGSRLSTVFQIFGMGAGAAGKFAAAIGRAGSLFMGFGRGALVVGRALLPFGQGMLMTFIGPLRLLAQGGMWLGRVLGGQLVNGLMLAGRTVLWLGRALMLNPIGIAITAIAVGAYLIYRYWTPIKQFFGGVWNSIRTAFAGGIGSVMRLIINWSPLGLFYRAFAGVLGWFGVRLPKTFTDFGSHLIDGLVNGIRNRFTSAKNTLVEFGSNVKAWFANTLGIKSPSRVFMGFGDNIAQGAAIGIGRSSAIAARAAAGMATQAAAAASLQRINAARGGAPAGASVAGSGITVHFSPTITVQGGSPDGVKDQVKQGLNLSLRDLERMLDDLLAKRERRAYRS